MTLRGRIIRLEARKAPAEASGARERLAGLLARIEGDVLASGDTLDRPEAPRIERAVRRYLRGEAEPAEALRDLVAGRWPCSSVGGHPCLADNQ